jgi:hypothetical protein
VEALAFEVYSHPVPGVASASLVAAKIVVSVTAALEAVAYGDPLPLS